MSPEFTPQIRKRIEELILRYPRKEGALLPVLHLVQREFGSISAAEEEMVARIFDLNPIRVREVVTFYTMFSRRPLGKYHIQVCSNLSCSLLGAEKLTDYLEKKLGIKVGETTPDGKFSLSTVECLGACEQAPSLMVNFEYHGRLDKAGIDGLMESLK